MGFEGRMDLKKQAWVNLERRVELKKEPTVETKRKVSGMRKVNRQKR